MSTRSTGRASRAGLLGAAVILLLAACSGDGPSAGERLDSAREHLADGDLRAASIELKNALRAEPDNPEARFMLGRVSVGMGMGAAAEKELRRAGDLGKSPSVVAYWLARAIQQQEAHERLLAEVTVQPEWSSTARARVTALRAQAHAALGEVPAARQALEAARELDPRGLETRLAALHIALAAQPPAAAAGLAAEVTEAHPQSLRAWRLRARAALEAGDHDAAEQHFGRAIELAHLPLRERVIRARIRLVRGRTEAAREDVDWLTERMPAHPSVMYTQGLLAWATERRDAACRHFASAVSAAPDMRGPRFYAGVCHYTAGEYNQAEAHLLEAYQGAAIPSVARVLGATYLAQERPERAREVVRPILQRDPDDRGALALMARIEEAMGDSGQAIAHLRRLAELEPDDPRVRLQLGAGLLSTGELEAGRSALSEALSLDPGFGEAGALLVMSYVEREEYERALASARELANRRSEAPMPRTLEGHVHLAAGDRAAARAAFRAALELDPGEPGARHALARMALEAGEAERARTHYRAVLEADPEHVDTLTALATLAGRSGRADEAEALLERARGADPGALGPRLLLARLRFSRGQPEQALAVLQDEDGVVPTNADALVLASRARLAAGQHGQALPDIRRLLGLRPESTVPYVLLAQAHGALGQPDEALAQMERILELDPDHPLALLVKARVHIARGETEPAAELLGRVPEGHRDHPAYLDARGRLALRNGQRDAALDFYRRAHEVAPSSRTVTRLAALEQGGGNDGRARRLLREWVEAHPRDADAQLELGDLLAMAGDDAAAAEAYRAVLDSNPGSAVAMNNLAWVLRGEDPDEALRLAREAVRLRPDEPRFLDTLGMALLDTGRAEEAVARLRTAVSQDPDDPTLRYHLARALVAVGRRDEARSELRTMLDGGDEVPDTDAARSLLESLNGE